MDTKIFRARTSKEAFSRISSELGPDAIIIEQKKTRDPDGTVWFEVTAAPREGIIEAPREAPAGLVSILKNKALIAGGIGGLTVVIILLAITAIIFWRGGEEEQVPAELTKAEDTQIERTIPSVAILAFADMSPEGDQEWFCDGIADEIIHKLAMLKGLKVPARTSAFRFKGEKVDIQEIGKQLNVKAVLEGSVRKVGGQLRITAQLSNVEDGFHIWSQEYNRKLEDVFDIQEEIALAVVRELRVELGVEEQERLAKRYTDDVEVDELYKLGRFHSSDWTYEGFLKTIDYYNLVLEKDPDFARVYADLAWIYHFLGTEIRPGLRQEYYPKAKSAALKALELDDELPEAHTSLGQIKRGAEGDLIGAEKHYKRALELAPGSSFVHERYTIHLLSTGLFDEAVAEAERAVELDPFSVRANHRLGFALFWAGRYEEAIASFEKAIDLRQGFHYSYEMLAHCHAMLGNEEAAIAYMNKGDPGKENFFMQANCLANLGKREECLKTIERWLEQPDRISSGLVGLVYVALGEYDLAFEWFERHYREQGHIPPAFLTRPPVPQRLGCDQRYIELLEKVGLKDFAELLTEAR